MELEGPFGEGITPLKANDRIRIGFQNFGGWTTNKEDPTDKSFQKWITDMQFDVFGIVENNLYWPWVPVEWKLENRMKNLFQDGDTKTAWAYNTNYKPETIKQWGGTGQISRGRASLRLYERGKDPLNLGRWVWQSFRGLQGRQLKVFTVYRACDKRNSSGTQNSFHQQRHHLLGVGRDINPREALLTDLETEVSQCHEAGHLVIVMMDCNESTSSQSMKHFLERSNLHDVVARKHGHHTPPTRKGGSTTIDGIFASWAIDPIECGICGEDEGVEGPRADHKCVWMDIMVENAFGHKMEIIQNRVVTRCNSRDPRVYNKYNSLFIQFMEEHNLEERMFRLERAAVFPLPTEWVEEAERIDKLYIEGHSFADRRCRRIMTGGTAYTPQFNQLLARLMFLKTIIRGIQNANTRTSDRVLVKYLKRAKDSTKLGDYKRCTIEELREELKTTYKELREYRKNDQGKRQAWLQELAAARAEVTEEQEISAKEKGDRRKAKRKKEMTATERELRELRMRELIRYNFKRIKAATGKAKTARLTMVERPIFHEESGATEWKECSDKIEMEEACLVENENRFTQAHAAPFNSGALGLQMGQYGVSKYAEEILQGTYINPPNTTPYVNMLLPYLRRVPQYDTFPPAGITTQEYKQGWGKMKEYTGAAPWGTQFSQNKATTFNDRVADFMASHASVPWKSGYAYQRWRKGIDVELQKKTNSWKTKDLRTIVLLDSQFNFGNKVMSRRIARSAEHNKGFAMEQFGSRKKHRAIEHALNKKLTFDLARLNRQNLAICSNDLKSCYDRINHSFASICLQRQGMEKSEATCMFDTLQTMQHSVRTAFGDSTQSMGGNGWQHQCSSIYQGNGAGPIIWAAVSSPLLEALRNQGFGTHFLTATSGSLLRFCGYMFVDDMDLAQTGNTVEETPGQVGERMQQNINMWEGLVNVSGGALNIQKCAWWLISFKWSQDGEWEYEKIEEQPHQLVAKDFDGAIKVVERKEHNMAFETLGVKLAPSGDAMEALNALEAKANQWADSIRASNLRHHEVTTAIGTTILKTMEYPLPVLELSEKQSRRLMKPILYSGLSKAGTVRYLNRRLLYGPQSHLGMAVHDMYTSAIVDHVEMLVRHGPQDTMTGKLIRATLEAAKIEIGWSGQFFDIPTEVVQLLGTQSWVKMTHQEMTRHNIAIFENTPSITKQRQGDQVLTEMFWAAGIRGQKMKWLNRCRLWMRVSTVGDITQGNGRTLLPGVMEGQALGQKISPFNYPNQGKPSARVWHYWRKTLRKCLGMAHDADRMAGPLGKWIRKIQPSEWPCWKSPKTGHIYLKSHNEWEKLAPIRGLQGTNQNFPVTERVEHLPDQVIPAIGWRTPTGSFRFSGAARLRDPVNIPPINLVTGVQQAPSSVRWAIQHLEVEGDWRVLCNEIRMNRAFAVTDGSFKNKQGTSAFTVRTTGQENVGIVGVNMVPGDSDTQCAYRSELAGILGVLALLHVLCQLENIHTGSITIACDNQTAGRLGLESTEMADPQSDHYDLLRLIFNTRQNLPLRVNYRYVEAHQLTKYPTRELDRWGWWNEAMDLHAKWFLDNTMGQARPELRNQDRPWTAVIDKQLVVKNMKQSLRNYITKQRLEEWWVKSGKFTRHQISLIDFESTEAAMQQCSPHRRRWIVKYAAHQLPTGRQMVRRGHWTEDRCPRCRAANEDTPHILTCPDNSSRQLRERQISKLEVTLKEIGTKATVQEAIIKLLNWYLLEIEMEFEGCHEDIQHLCQHQFAIGIEQLLMGRLGKAWTKFQGNDNQGTYASKVWAVKLIHNLWEISWENWDHRNTTLKSPEVQDRMHNMQAVDLNILNEWQLGEEHLLELDRRLFRSSADEILQRPSAQRRDWLAAVQRARITWQHRSETE